MPDATILTRSIQGESLSAATDRLANLAFRAGVIDEHLNSYKVAQDTGSNMQIKVGSGTAYDRAVVEGSNAGQGNYICEHQDATVTLPIASADPTNDRIDLVILRVYDDTFDSSGDEFSDIEVITGTPAGSPSAPATPDSSLVLATVEVGASVSAITNSDINDQRIEAPVRGQYVQTVYFTSSGSFVKANYPWLSKVKAIVQGAGGAGGGAATTSAGQSATGGGGGSGGYSEKLYDVEDLSASGSVTVGAAGVGATGTDGGSGGNSSFASQSSDGGTGGLVTGASSAPVASYGGNGGSVSGGDVQQPGGLGSFGWINGTSRMHGIGSSSPLGRNQTRSGSGSGGVGLPGEGYGSGGGAAQNGQSQGTARAGGNGAPGIVILELYA